MGWGSIIGNLVSSYLQADAAKDAARDQRKQGEASNVMSWDMYQQNRADMMPWRTMGAGAVSKLSERMGLGAPPAFNPAAAQQDTVPAMITPKEAMTLKKLGGAGAVDPRTGLLHYYPARGGGEGDSDDAIDRAGGRDPMRERADRETRSMPSAPVSDIRPSQSAFGVNPTDQYNVATRTGISFDPKAALAGFAAGGIPGALAGFGTKEVWDTWGSGRPPGNPRDPSNQRDPGNMAGGVSPLRPGTAPAGTGGFTPAGTARPSPMDTRPSPMTGQFGEWDRNFTMADFKADPAYQFIQDEAMRAYNRNAAAHGGLNSGDVAKSLIALNQNLANTQYGNSYNRWMNDRSTRFNMLSNLAGMGQTASGAIGNYGQNTANFMGNTMQDIGNVNAAGRIGQANAWSTGLNNIFNIWNQAQAQKKVGGV